MDSLGILLKDTSHLLRRRFDGHARSVGVPRSQWQVLSGVSRFPGINQAGLADQLDIENITLGRMVDRLEEAGLVERRADPGDRRMWRLHLMPKAQPVLETLHRIADRLQVEAVAGLSEHEIETLMDLLARVRANVAAGNAQTAQA